MALTIRTIDDDVRRLLDKYKLNWGIKTDSKAFIKAVCLLDQIQSDNVNQLKEIQMLESKLAEYQRIFLGLEKYMAGGIELIKQQELNF